MFRGPPLAKPRGCWACRWPQLPPWLIHYRRLLWGPSPGMTDLAWGAELSPADSPPPHLLSSIVLMPPCGPVPCSQHLLPLEDAAFCPGMLPMPPPSAGRLLYSPAVSNPITHSSLHPRGARAGRTSSPSRLPSLSSPSTGSTLTQRRPG